MVSPYWVNTGNSMRLAVAPCPDGGSRLDTEIASLRDEGVDVLVSMQTPTEMRALGLAEEPQACERAGVRFLWLPVVDHRVPSSLAAVRQIVEILQAELAAGKGVAAHCFAGVGRSVLLVACVLCAEGWTPEQTFDAISEARGFRVPETREQMRWIREFAATLREPVR